MDHPLRLLQDIAYSIIFATLCAHAARLLRQPLIIGYVFGGILLGAPMGLGLVSQTESIELISEIGLLFLLFIIGLEINLKELLRMGRSMFTLGIVQFAGCVLLALPVYKMLFGARLNGPYDITYLAVTTALSSTLIVVKLLADKFEVNTTAGRLTVGVLVLQDIWAMLFMAFQPNLSHPEWLPVTRSLGLGVLLAVAAFVISRYVLLRVFRSVSKKPELVLLTAIGWCFALAGLAEKAELSKEMGALIAGLSIAAYPYGTDVVSKLIGVRDFFVTLFFVSLGLKMPRPDLALCGMSFLVGLIVLATRLLTVAPAVLVSGNGLRIGVISALNLAQISEFSLVIVSLGAAYGHVSTELGNLILASMLLTSMAATYVIMLNNRIVAVMLKLLGMLTPKHMRDRHKSRQDSEDADIVLLGCFREGLAFLETVSEKQPELKSRILAVDFNQALEPVLKERGFRWHYADLAQPETLEHLGIEKARLIICSLSDTYLKGITSSRLLAQLRSMAPRAKILMTADDAAKARQLEREGASAAASSSSLVGSALVELVRKHLPVV